MKLNKPAAVVAILAVIEATTLSMSAWAAPNDERARRLIEVPSRLSGEEITAATVSASGLLALGTATGRVFIGLQHSPWERRAGSSAIRSLAFAPDETAIAGSTDEEVIVWRSADQGVAKIPVQGSPSAMALSPGGRVLAVANLGVSVFDVAGQRLLREFEQSVDDGGASAYEAVAFSPDGSIVAAAGLDNIDAWAIETDKKVQHWSCKCGADGVALSRDASLAVVGTTAAEALLWELASGKVLKDKTMSVIEGDHVYGTAVSLKGMLVAAGTASGSVAVWDTGSGVIVARAHPSDRPVVRITSSDDGRTLLVEVIKEPYVRGNYDRWLMTLPRR